MNTYPRHHRPGITSRGLIVATILVTAVIFGFCLVLVSSVLTGSGEKAESTQRRLLYATNPTTLMDACKQLAQAAAGSDQPAYPDPQSPTLPPILQKVHPKTITVDKNRVTLECGTNIYHFGLVIDVDTTALPPTTPTTGPTTRPQPPMATRQIAPGIWYYAQDGAIPGP
jgi:type II secretory pathway pseudopilin PulG